MTLAGCLDGSEPPADTHNQGPIPPPDAATIDLEDCMGVVVVIPWPTPIEAAPGGFRAVPAASVVPAAAQYEVEMIRCPRVVFGSSLSKDVALLWSYLWVEPMEKGWAVPGAQSLWLLDVLTSDAATASALSAAGLPAQVARFEATPLLDQSNAHRWALTADETSFAIDFRRESAPGPEAPEARWHLWAGNGPYDRINATRTLIAAPHDGYGPAHMSLRGSSALRARLGVDESSQIAQAVHSTSWILDATPVSFPKR